jgi:hypothetical protein
MPIVRMLNPYGRLARFGLILPSILLAAGVFAAGSAAAPASYDGISANGRIAIFSTSERMVPGDTDPDVDIYERTFDVALNEFVTREVSIGPTGGNDTLPATFDGISSDGKEVFFSTRERLVPADKDHSADIYVRNLTENRTFLASEGGTCSASGCGNGPTDASFVPNGVPTEGGRVFFATTEKLSPADEDEAMDVYVHDMQNKTTTLVSAADPSCGKLKCGNLANSAQFQGTDRNGDNAFFSTTESLVEADTDTSVDIYERDLGTGETHLVSVAGTCPIGLNCDPTYGGASPDGSHVFFETNEQISVADKDSSQDVYDWSGGEPALASTGPDGGEGPFDATFAGSSSSGETVYFQTDEQLDPVADTDHTQDVYERSGMTTSLVSAGEEGRGNGEVPATFAWASRTGATDAVLFSTREALTSEDDDTSLSDVYERSAGTTLLVSFGPEGTGTAADATFKGASDNGSKVFFVTAESLSSEDRDHSPDVYMSSPLGTVLISIGPVGGNAELADEFSGVSNDGSRAYFTTQERLTEKDDFAGEEDVYGWSPAGTLLVSVKNSDELVLGPAPPSLEGTDPVSPNPSTQPAVIGQAALESVVKLYTTFDCSGEPVAHGTAQELASGLAVEVPAALESTTNYRATAEKEGVVSVCSSPISYTQAASVSQPPPAEGGTGTDTGTGTGTGSGGGGETGSGGTPSGGGSSSGGARHDGVAYVAPQARITFGPAAKTRLRRPTFRFADAAEQPGTRFICRVDKHRWAGCDSPTKVARLGFGRHMFLVKAVNAVGVAGPAPVKRAFKVVRP